MAGPAAPQATCCTRNATLPLCLQRLSIASELVANPSVSILLWLLAC